MADVLPAIPNPPGPVQPPARGRRRNSTVKTVGGHWTVLPVECKAELLAAGTGPGGDVSTADGPVWAVPVFDGFIAAGYISRTCPPWPTVAYSPVYRNWAHCDSVAHAAARAGYGVRAEAGRDSRVTVTRTLVVRPAGNTWTAFACARSLSGDAAEAHAVLPLADDLQGIVGGFLTGLTPPEVLLDFLADHGPADLRDRFAALAGRFL